MGDTIVGASGGGHTDVIGTLIAAGANPNTIANNDRGVTTPLWIFFHSRIGRAIYLQYIDH